MEEREAYFVTLNDYKDEIKKLQRQFNEASELRGNVKQAALAEIFTQRTVYEDSLLRCRKLAGRVGLTSSQFYDLVEAGTMAREIDDEIAAIIVKMIQLVHP